MRPAASKKRRDPNHAEIVRLLRSVGCTVVELSGVGAGVPDILVGYRGRNHLVEIKAGGETLNDYQEAWHASWKGEVRIARTGQEALKVVGALL